MHMLDSALPSHGGTVSDQGRLSYEQSVDHILIDDANGEGDYVTQYRDDVEIMGRT